MAAPPSVSKPTSGSSSGRPQWSQLLPMHVGSEDSMDPKERDKVWEKMYRDAGLGSPDEITRAGFRLAVYIYGRKNGTSRVGNYVSKIVMNNGHTFDAAVIPRATGNMNIRRFFRSNMNESYEALKSSGAIEADERCVAQAAKLGIDASCAFAMADWMSGCPLFTPAEAAAYDASFTYALSRARRARDGKTLEAVESGRRDANLDAQGPLNDAGMHHEF